MMYGNVIYKSVKLIEYKFNKFIMSKTREDLHISYKVYVLDWRTKRR